MVAGTRHHLTTDVVASCSKLHMPHMEFITMQIASRLAHQLPGLPIFGPQPARVG